MAYAPLDEHFDEHPKYEGLELEHFGLMACAFSYCNRLLTDGVVPDKAVRGFGRSGKGPKIAAKLVENKIWHRFEGGYRVVGFLDHNPSREEVLAKREAARAKKEGYRKGTLGKAGGGPAGSPPPSPVPEIVPRGQARGQASGRPEGQDAGQDEGQASGQIASVPRDSRAAAPVRDPIHCTSLHGTALQEIPPRAPASGRLPKDAGLAPGWVKSRMVSDGTAGMMSLFEAYVSAVGEAVGAPIGIPNDAKSRSHLALALNTHFAGSDSVSTAIVAMCAVIPDWVDIYREKAALTAGWSPKKFLDHLNERAALPPEEEPPPRGEPVAPAAPAVQRTPAQLARRQEQLAELEATGLGEKFCT